VQPERIQVAVRPRGGWEAVDLGFRMARHWWRPIFAAWCALVFPVAIVLNVALVEHLWLAALILWWLKPAFDRIPLYVLSEALFGHVPTVRETLGALPTALRPGLLRSLSVMRPSPLRSFTLPVMQLEGLRGSARRERARLLIGRDSSVGLGLIFACASFEWLVAVMGLLSLVWFLLPEAMRIGFDTILGSLLFGGGTTWQSLLRNGILLLAMTAIEPFYVAGGFSLYINRRVYLEGWDIDLVFRKLVRRAAAEHRPSRGSGAVAGFVLLALLAATPVRAEEPGIHTSCAASRAEDAKPCIELILRHPDFSSVEEVEIWVPKLDVESNEVETGSDFSLGIGGLFAALFETLVWVLLAVAVIVLIAFALRRISPQARSRPAEREPPEVLFGLDVRRESLPDDVIAAARGRWAEGDAIGALSLLYRAALVYLVSARGLEVSASATEGECTKLARRAVEAPLSEAFDSLTNAWLYCAYGERPPEADAFAELCESWRPHLEPAP
jgi:hypothetical protein